LLWHAKLGQSRARHGVVHERTRQQLRILVVDDRFAQHLPEALNDAAMDLSLHQHRVDEAPDVVHDRVA
jgi:hypothetical protein